MLRIAFPDLYMFRRLIVDRSRCPPFVVLRSGFAELFPARNERLPLAEDGAFGIVLGAAAAKQRAREAAKAERQVERGWLRSGSS